MIKLRPVFSNHALFLHSSELTVYGQTEPDSEIKAEIIMNGKTVSFAEGRADENGMFGVILKTPKASFNAHELKVSNGREAVKIEDVLFGELWLAGGQSNMEMENHKQIDFDKCFESIQGKQMRFYYQYLLDTYLPDTDGVCYPTELTYTLRGEWATMDMRELIGRLSACGTQFSSEIFDFLNKNSETPVGFVSANRGGSRIEPWLPQNARESDEVIKYHLENNYKFLFKEEINGYGMNNHQQPGVLFNVVVAPIIGLKFRGFLWYQGEGNSVDEYAQRIYSKLLIALYNSYKEIFAPNGESFPMIAVLIYPCSYESGDETVVGYLNKAITDIAKVLPENEFTFIPVSDIKPIWAFENNYPIHPLHKYTLANRLALMCMNSVYGRKVPKVQKRPAMLKSCVRHGSKLRLTFSDTGSGIYINGRLPRGLYICGKDGIYTPAYCEIVNRSVMNVYHPSIEKPCHVAYGVSSQEVRTNLFAGEFPVAPFCTQMEKGEPKIYISLKPWLNMENDSEFIPDTNNNVFSQPIYRPSANSAVCFDSDFTITGRSLRVWNEGGETFGTYVLAKRYNTLDLYNYSVLKVSLLNTKGLTAKLAFSYAEKDGVQTVVTVDGVKETELGGGWAEYVFDLTKLHKGEIKHMEFIFKLVDNKIRSVCIDSPILMF